MSINKKRTIGGKTFIYLSNGWRCVIDSNDYPKVKKYFWFGEMIGGNKYCVHRAYDKGKFSKIYIHRLINNTPKHLLTDHIDGDGLNNIKSNLRSATRAQNNTNKRKRNNTKSRYKGLIWNNQTNKWQVIVHAKGEHFYLGSFSDETKAALAYNEASRKYHGEFSRPNKI